jgi:hypothetical protein
MAGIQTGISLIVDRGEKEVLLNARQDGGGACKRVSNAVLNIGDDVYIEIQIIDKDSSPV